MTLLHLGELSHCVGAIPPLGMPCLGARGRSFLNIMHILDGSSQPYVHEPRLAIDVLRRLLVIFVQLSQLTPAHVQLARLRHRC